MTPLATDTPETQRARWPREKLLQLGVRPKTLQGEFVKGPWGAMHWIANQKPETELTDWWLSLSLRYPDPNLPGIDLSMDDVMEQFTFPVDCRRADIVIAHRSDLLAVVIEVKSGAYGESHVVQGIGQALSYADDFSLTFGRKAFPALLWDGLNDPWKNARIERICKDAGVIPLGSPPHAERVAAGGAVFL